MTEASEVFTVAVGDAQAAAPKQEVASFDSLSLSMSLDAGSDASFTIPGSSPSANVVNELASDVWLYRFGSIIARYRIVAIGQAWGEDGEDVVSITAVDYKRLLNARHLQSSMTFTDRGQADLVADLIEHTQSQTGGDWGIVNGVLDNDDRERDRSYVIGENIGSLLANLSSVIGGPSWSIDGHLRLNVRSGRSSTFPVQAIPIMLGGTARGLERSSGASDFANSVFVDGDNAFTVPATANSAGIVDDPRGRWERAEGFPSVVLQQTLQEKAEGLVDQYATPVATWSCDIEPSRYLTDAAFSPGDLVTVVVPATVAAPIGNPGFSVTGQVMNVALSFTGDGELSVGLEVIETPGVLL